MRKAALFTAIFLIMLVTPIAVRYFQFYRPFSATRAAPPQYSAAGIAAVPTPEASDFQDAPELSRTAANGSAGIAILDQAHDNQIALDEVAYLDALLAGRGIRLAPFEEGDLGLALRSAGALVVIAPVNGYSEAEVMAVRDFVNRGGRVLLVGDPTRYSITFDEDDLFAPAVIQTAQIPLNDLANAFDITFRGDYLYNTVENEGNFRNILLGQEGFAEGALTDGLERLALYSSHSLQTGPAATALLTADENTWSSSTDRPGELTLAALSSADEASGGQVLAVGDVHFMTEPYNSVYDNGAFAARVADFLVGGGDSAEGLASFPYFFRPAVDLVYVGGPDLGPDAFDDIIALQSAMRQAGLSLALAAEADPEHDTLYLGVYNQADDVADLLEQAGVELTIRPAITPPPDEAAGDEEAESGDEPEPAGERVIESALGRVQMAGSALIVLDSQDDRQQVVVLAASGEGLERVVERLRAAVPVTGADLSDCLVQGPVAICPTDIANEPVEYELESSGPGDIDTSPPEDGDDDEEAGGGEPGGDEPGGGDATDQGPIGLGETQSGELAAEEAHAWTFSDGPAVIDIVVEGSDDMDTIIELYDPEGVLMGNVDSTFAGGVEEMLGIEIPDDGDYAIVVRDFFADGGNYEISVTEGEPGDTEENSALERIFIFEDDDGEPLGEGFTSASIFVEFLSADYDVTLWTASDGEPIPADTLQEYDLVIWDSGTYRDENGLLGDDTGAILEYVDAGGDILITGASPTLFSSIELAPLEAVAVAAGDPILSEGFTDGEVIALDGEYETALIEPSTTGPDDTVFLVRGPEEAEAGMAIGLAGVENGATGPKSALLLLAFAALPDEAQAQLLANVIAWFAG
jgi:hypothetical protein